MAFVAGAYANIVLFRTNPADVRYRKEEGASSGFENYASDVLGCFAIFLGFMIEVARRNLIAGNQGLSRHLLSNRVIAVAISRAARESAVAQRGRNFDANFPIASLP